LLVGEGAWLDIAFIPLLLLDAPLLTLVLAVRISVPVRIWFGLVHSL
jgi:hypothetical protein